MKTPMKSLSVTLLIPESLYPRLCELCEACGCNTEDMIQDVIESWLKRENCRECGFPGTPCMCETEARVKEKVATQIVRDNLIPSWWGGGVNCIPAIKAIRAHFGYSLTEAKEVCDAVRERHPEWFAAPEEKK